MYDSLGNPTENFKFSLLRLFPYYLQIVQRILKISSQAEFTRMSGDGRRLLLDKVRSRNSNNYRTQYYNLSIILYLGGCYNNNNNNNNNNNVESKILHLLLSSATHKTNTKKKNICFKEINRNYINKKRLPAERLQSCITFWIH